METPPVHYTQTEDGISLAYMTWGTGPPLIVLRNPRDSNVQEEWGLPELADWYAALGEAWRVVRFDHRGCGGSDPSPEPSLADYLRDIQAVQTATDADPAVILSPGRTATVALELAARRGESISGLALLQPAINFGSVSDDEPYTHIAALRRSSPSIWQETIALWMGWRERASRDAFVQIGLANEPANVAYSRALRRYSLEEVLPEISVATVVIRLNPSLYPSSPGRHIARAVPGAKLVALSSEGQELAFADREGLLRILDDFRPAGGASLGADGARFRTILFTDLAASTATTQRLGDSASQDLVRAHNEIVRPALAAHDGYEIKHTGDGIMAWFPAASNALDCAQAIQHAVTDLANPDLGVKIGLNAGEPIAEEDDLYGTAVQIAARVTDQAAAGEIVCTNVMRELVAGKSYMFSEREPAALKGVEEPVRLFTLGGID